MEDDAVAAFGVGPGDGSCFIADEIARAALKAVFVVEQNATVTGGNKKVCWARHDTFTGCATSTRVAINGDMRAFMNAELGSFNTFLERHFGPRVVALNVGSGAQ